MEEEKEEGGGEGRGGGGGGSNQLRLTAQTASAVRAMLANSFQPWETSSSLKRERERQSSCLLGVPLTPQYLKGVQTPSHRNPFIIEVHS